MTIKVHTMLLLSVEAAGGDARVSADESVLDDLCE